MASSRDGELRSELKRLGFDPGPIMESTRWIYENKLKKLQSEKTGRECRARNSTDGVIKNSRQQRDNSSCSPVPSRSGPPLPAAGSTTRSRENEHPSISSGGSDQFSLPLTPTSPSPSPRPSRPPPATVSIPPCPSVVSNLLLSLNSVHIASDTVFLFPAGDVFLASRSILATQCQALIPLLYNREGLLTVSCDSLCFSYTFAVNVATMTGHSAQFFVRPSELVMDLKEKISLSEAVSLQEQQLFLNKVELRNGMAVHQTGMRPGSTIHLVLNSDNSHRSTTTTFFSSAINPSLSIYHCNLHLGMEQVIPVGVASGLLPPRVPLPPHLLHIVHMYDVPFSAWTAFIYFLYSQQLKTDVSLEVAVCCWVLSQKFAVSHLSRLSLSLIQHKVTPSNAAPLYQYANLINANSLKEICRPFLLDNPSPSSSPSPNPQ